MYLADVLPYDPSGRPIREKIINLDFTDTVSTVRDSIDAAKDAVCDSLEQSQVIFENAVQNEASLLLPIAVIALALGACLYLAYTYRQRLAAK